MNGLRIAVFFGLAAAATASIAATSPVSRAGTSAPPQAASSSAAGTSSKKKRSHKKKTSARESSQRAPTPERITEIQSALSRGGYYQGDPNGRWDPDTVAAMEKFQSAHGIDASGKLDAPTLQKLGLGSDIAGVSAPKPVTPPAATAPASQQQSANPPPGATLAR